jgi:hypothetical protein
MSGDFAILKALAVKLNSFIPRKIVIISTFYVSAGFPLPMGLSLYEIPSEKLAA